MSHQFDLGVYGGDLRQVYMITSLLKLGYRIATYCIAEPVKDENCTMVSTLTELFEGCRVLIGPVPMSRDQFSILSKNPAGDLTIAHVAYLIKKHHILVGGNIPAPITDICNKWNTPCFDLMKDEQITILNAIATAEGTIMEAIQTGSSNLHGSDCLVLGYGRCAKVLAAKLKALDAGVTIAARSQEARAYAVAAGHQSVPLSELSQILPSFSFIFNTIPQLILAKAQLDLVHPQVTIIDIASAPGGVDFDYAKHLNITAKLCLGLPGKVAPLSSGEILAAGIHSFLLERSD